MSAVQPLPSQRPSRRIRLAFAVPSQDALDNVQRHWLIGHRATARRDALGGSDPPLQVAARNREAPHVQFNFALIYSVSGFIQGGHFQA